MSRGVVYCLDGKNENAVGNGVDDFFLKETLMSAESVKRKCPGLPITIFSNRDHSTLRESGFFNNILPCPEDNNDRPFINKISSCVHSPYDETLFLDGDTLVLVNLQDIFAMGYEKYTDGGNLFDVLKNNDMAFCLESLGSAKGMTHPEVPDSFSRFNTGVLLWKRNSETSKFFKEWLETYRDSTNFDPSKNDQWQFRMSVWNSKMKYCILDHAYNQRFYAESGACGDGSYVQSEPFHRHHPNNADKFWTHVKDMNYINPFKIVHDRLLIHNLGMWFNGRYYERTI